MSAPVRVQLSRRKGFRLQEVSLALNGLPAVKVDRTTKWGNPFKIGEINPCFTVTANARHAAALYCGFAPQNETLVKAAQAELAGKNLACWCDLTDKCHADTLLRIANRPPEPASVGTAAL